MRPDVQHRVWYVASDYVTTSVAWLLFNFVRYKTLEELTYADSLAEYLAYPWVLWGQLLVPLMMMGLYWLSGFYNSTFMKSRMEAFGATLGSVVIGVVIVYFAAIIDDPIPDRYSNYILLLIMALLFIAMVLPARLVITWVINRRVAHDVIDERVLVVGDRNCVESCLTRLKQAKVKNGLTPVAVTLLDAVDECSYKGLTAVSFDNIALQCQELDVVKIIIALPAGDTVRTMSLVRSLYSLELPILIPAWNAGDLLANMRVRNVAGEPFTDISSVDISESQRNVKRLVDVVLSAMSLVVIAPVIAVLAVLIKKGFQWSCLL